MLSTALPIRKPIGTQSSLGAGNGAGAAPRPHDLVRILQDNKVAVNMPPYENATAERLNGILDNELLN